MSAQKYDHIIIGAGLSGLFSAVLSGMASKKVLLLTGGVGSLTIGSGTIDLLGIDNSGNLVADPLQVIETLDKTHPYSIIGKPAIESALEVFRLIMKRHGYEYISRSSNIFVPTGLGTLKPSYLVPKSMDAEILNTISNICVVGIVGLKDFSATLVAGTLKNLESFRDKKIIAKDISLKNQGARDFSAMDIAGLLENEKFLETFIAKLATIVNKGDVVIIPPILGLKPSYDILNKIEKVLGCFIIEASSIAPAVTGYRLRKILLDILKHFDIEIVESARAVRATFEDRVCKSIICESAAGFREYFADNFIIATGGFFGNGLINKNDKTTEVIFGIDIESDDTKAADDFGEKQSFAKCGVAVDNDLNAIDKDGAKLFTNVYFAGRILKGADSVYELSGNGIALVSSYLVAKRLKNV